MEEIKKTRRKKLKPDAQDMLKSLRITNWQQVGTATRFAALAQTMSRGIISAATARQIRQDCKRSVDNAKFLYKIAAETIRADERNYE